MEAQKPNTPQKPVAAKSKKTQGEHKVRGIKNAFLVILCCAVIAVCLYIFVFGDASHFDPQTGHPLPGDFLGTIYMGGVIVPVLQTLLLTVIVLSVERWIALRSAKGTGSITKFVANVKACLVKGDIAAAEALCAKQKGSVAAVVKSALLKYKEMDQNTDYSYLLVSELLKRHNTGRILMKAYQDVPLTYPYTDYLGNERWTWNDNGSNFLEMILVQQEVQNHLTPWEKKDLMNLADEKQQEKFADPRYPISSAKHNYLYTDTYGYRNQDIFGKLIRCILIFF